MINVVIFTATWDTGGQGYRIKRAFEKYQPNFSVRSIHMMDSHMAYPHDLRYTPEVAYPLFAEADVIHMRNGLEGLKRLRKDAAKRQGLLVHHHGTRFREAHATIYPAAVAAGAKQIASTLDLTLLYPDISWLPSPFDLSELGAIRAGYVAQQGLASSKGGRIRIAHAPTNREVKQTTLVLNAVSELAGEGLPVEFDLIERATHDEVLRRKAKADIVVDQLQLGYGNNSIEAWGMGIPVVAGIADSYVRENMTALFGGLPFYEARETTLVERLRELITDSDLRAHWGEVGRQHAVTYHDDKAVARLLASYYRETIDA